MNTSMYTVYALKQNFSSPVEAFKHFYSKGIHYADVLDAELSKIPLDLYCRYLEEAGMKADALISTLNIADVDLKQRRENNDKVKRYIDKLSRLNIPMIMLAPDVVYAKTQEDLKIMQHNLIESLQNAVEYSKGSGVTVTIENQSVNTRCDSKTDDVRYILDCIPDLKFVLDSGNFFCVKEDVLYAYEMLKDRMIHVHFKDWMYAEKGGLIREGIKPLEGVALGDGLLPLKELINNFAEDGYEGNIVLEVNNPKELSLHILDCSADFLRRELNV